MGPVSAKVVIDVPREDVFDILLDLAVRPSFTDHLMEGFHLLRIESAGVGAGARFRLRDGGWVDSIIEDADAPHRLVERGRGGYLNRIPNVMEWLLSEAGQDGCEVQVTFWTEPANAFDKLRDAKASERRFGKGLKKALERLRGVAESGVPPERIAVAGGDRI
jgi:uncharacterized protein YndB with AHSA1/START domain